MLLDQMNGVAPNRPLMDTAWTVLEASDDLGDRETVDISRRVIDALLRGIAPAKSDLDVIFDFFGQL